MYVFIKIYYNTFKTYTYINIYTYGDLNINYMKN